MLRAVAVYHIEKKNNLGRGDGKNLRARSWGGELWNTFFWTLCSYWNHEVRAVIVTDTRSSQLISQRNRREEILHALSFTEQLFAVERQNHFLEDVANNRFSMLPLGGPTLMYILVALTGLSGVPKLKNENKILSWERHAGVY